MNPTSRLAARPHFAERDLPGIMTDIERVLRSGILILGPETAALEAEFAAQVGTRHAIAVSSCTAALEIALRALGVCGREVLVPTNTFAATAAAALRAAREVQPGSAQSTAQAGRVTLYECDLDGNSSVIDAISRITADTAAIVVVHVAGFVPWGFSFLMAECQRRGIVLIEDCAHAHGATMGGRQVGSFGDAGCFSFYPTKITTCGVGGMVTTDRDDVAAAARSLRHHGQGASLEEVVAIGHDWLLDEVRAVLMRAQLRRLPEIIGHRRRVAAAYHAALTRQASQQLLPPRAASGTEPAYYKFPVALKITGSRAERSDGPIIRERMAARGISVGQLYWPPVHLMPAYAALGVQMPRTESILRRRVCLPMHELVDPADCAEIVEALCECVEE